MYRNIKYITLLITSVMVLHLTGCIENDIPYPRIPAQILSIKAEGMIGDAVINNEEQTVVLNMSEDVNLKRVKITQATVTETATKATTVTPSLVGTHDLSKPVKFTLSIYQDYEWTISTTQNIERSFSVAGQVGNAVIEPENKLARAFVSESTDLSQIEIIELILGPSGKDKYGKPITTYTPTPDRLHDFSKGPCNVTVKYHDIVEEWRLIVAHSESNVTLSSVDAWSCVAWLYGSGLEQNDNRFEIREATATEWSEVPDEYMVKRGSTFSARVIHLKPNTEYVARAFITGETSNEITFTTGPIVDLPNGGFNDWWLDGKLWVPWSQGGTPWWDTGNEGAATLGECNSLPTDDAVQGKAAMLETRFIGLAGIGKLGAGNIFVGDFAGVQGTNGTIRLGQPFAYRPTKLKGYYKYQTGAIDYTNDQFKNLKGKVDSMLIYIALGDWDEPVEVRTNPNDRKIFDENDPNIIAFNKIVTSKEEDEYVPFEIELEYRSTSRVPKYIIITATGSQYGDYFTGSTESVLYVDEFSLEWDY